MHISPILLTRETVAALRDLAQRAEAKPVDMGAIAAALSAKDRATCEPYFEQTAAQCIRVPNGMIVTYTVENGHPCGTIRHMSVDLENPQPNTAAAPQACWEFAKVLGFVGDLADCETWLEVRNATEVATHIAQPLTLPPRPTVNQVGRA